MILLIRVFTYIVNISANFFYIQMKINFCWNNCPWNKYKLLTFLWYDKKNNKLLTSILVNKPKKIAKIEIIMNEYMIRNW